MHARAPSRPLTYQSARPACGALRQGRLPASRLRAPGSNSTAKTAPAGAMLLATVALTVVAPAAATTTSCSFAGVPLSRNTARRFDWVASTSRQR